MSAQMCTFLNRKSPQDLIGDFVLLSDSEADGSFLVHHFLAQALKDGHVTCLVSFAQSFLHYSSVALKMGVNLNKMEETGDFVFVDCLTHLCTGRGHTEKLDDGGKPLSSRLSFSLPHDNSLQGLYQALSTSLANCIRAKPDKPVCLVIDDLSVVLGVGVRVVEVVKLVNYCNQMLCSRKGLCKGAGCLVAMVHCDEEPDLLLRAHLLHSARLSLRAEGLASGYCRDVHGQLFAEWRCLEQSSATSDLSNKQAQFKLTDRAVELFAPGTSRTVL